MLKTLEEPPAHVKFILATTDPQKIPVTVLSRCLQFNLKRLSSEQIAAQLKKILEAEGVAFDESSVAHLARGADGSMRDGLSLLDQAISFGGGRLVETEVRAMLGTIDQDTIDRALRALAASDARELLAVVSDAVDHGTDLEALLDELMRALHEIALAQADAALVEDERLRAHARALGAEDVQLYYQIGVLGRRDLPYAPDPRSGVEMTLLRMLAFRPVQGQATRTQNTSGIARTTTATVAPATPKPQTTETRTTPAAARPTTPTPPPLAATPVVAIENWNEMVAQLELFGFVREIANNTALESYADGALALVLDEAGGKLLSKEREAELKRALEAQLGRSIRLSIRVGKSVAETPAKERNRVSEEQQQAAVRAIQDDPNVQALQKSFGARVNPNSIRPKV
jgi:DNA polymerase-3 subunit gamma/tau